MPTPKFALALAAIGVPFTHAGAATVALVESLDAVPTGAREARATASALGVVVEADGFLVTTYKHLVDPATGALRPAFRVTVDVDGNPRMYRARIIGVEPTLDFAVLKVDDAEGLVPAELVTKSGLEVGQAIYAMGDATAKEGERVLGRLISLNSIECYQESLTQAMFAAEMVDPDAAVGSPVFDKSGQVIALYTGYEPPHDPNNPDEALDDESEVHLLPVHLINNIYESLKSRKSLASPWTGFSVRGLNAEEQARFPAVGGRFAGGIALDFVWPDSPAAEMGLLEGDILLQFAYHPTPSPAEFQKWLYMYGVGHKVKMYVLRGDQPLAFQYTIEQRPEWALPK